jgi:hypothetical protein
VFWTFYWAPCMTTPGALLSRAQRPWSNAIRAAHKLRITANRREESQPRRIEVQ